MLNAMDLFHAPVRPPRVPPPPHICFYPKCGKHARFAVTADTSNVVLLVCGMKLHLGYYVLSLLEQSMGLRGIQVEPIALAEKRLNT